MTRPVLATSTDGVGTKVAIAQALDMHDTIGFDLVGMVVDDIVVCGAEPLFMTDYIATGKVVPERIAAIVSGIAAACAQARQRPVGGETAEHPGLLGPRRVRRRRRGHRRGRVRRRARPAPGAWPATSSSPSRPAGLHSNGYSLVRTVVRRRRLGAGPRRRRARPHPRRGAARARPGSTPADLLDLIRADGVDVHALSHVTGGGLAANLARVLPRGSFAPGGPLDLDPAGGLRGRAASSAGCRGPTSSAPSTWASASSRCVPADQARRARCARRPARGLPAWVLGEVSDRADAAVDDGVEVVQRRQGRRRRPVQVVGTHPRA